MGRDHNYYVYLLASKRNGTLYCGVTGNLPGRIQTHREDLIDGFTRRHGVHMLVWYQWTDQIEAAILCEKQIKKWNRAWKLRLIEETNPRWDDLYPKLFGA
ncbi:MAG: GIY-YIG nuclease family protein [Devosia sp.]